MLRPTWTPSPVFHVEPAVPAGFLVALGWLALFWYFVVLLVCALGYLQIWRCYSHKPHKSYSSSLSSSSCASSPPRLPPHVTVIRPVKGLEPYLYECLAATFRQDYPQDCLTIYLCISSRSDPAYATLQTVLADFPRADARIFIEEEDPLLQDSRGPDEAALGPNPKIRNMSRAYREAKSDIVWIVDCNVWVGRGVCGRMVDKLCGYEAAAAAAAAPPKKYKFVHHLPIAVDVVDCGSSVAAAAAAAAAADADDPLLLQTKPLGGAAARAAWWEAVLASGGGRLEELFLSSSHAKMYTAINTVLIAPCIVGKSNMFRRSHLDYLTTTSDSATAGGSRRRPGIDFFSDNICEDHLIGDLLWKGKVPEETLSSGSNNNNNNNNSSSSTWGKHGLVFGDLVFQPVARMSVPGYIARRVRWLRVRKFTVLLATLVEPGTESILCSLYGAWGATTALPPLLQRRGYVAASLALRSWTAFGVLFALSLAVWILADWHLVYVKLHSAQTVELDHNTPSFARPPPAPSSSSLSLPLLAGPARRPFLHWLAAWLGREGLALPIWVWAFYGGVTVDWRDRRFKVGLDMKVREIDDRRKPTLADGKRKDRCD